MSDRQDIVILGTGSAGVAVLEAEPDLDVGFVERHPAGHHGGNSRYTTALMRLDADRRPVEGFAEYLMAYSDAKTDEALVEVLADEAHATVRWLEGHGVEFGVHTPRESAFLASSENRLYPGAGGARSSKPCSTSRLGRARPPTSRRQRMDSTETTLGR